MFVDVLHCVLCVWFGLVWFGLVFWLRCFGDLDLGESRDGGDGKHWETTDIARMTKMAVVVTHQGTVLLEYPPISDGHHSRGGLNSAT